LDERNPTVDRLLSAAAIGVTVLATMSERFQDEFIPFIRIWCERNATNVSRCYAALDQGYPSVYVVGMQPKTDRDALAQSLADLGQTLKRRGWQSNVVQIPREEAEHYEAFLEAEAAVLVFGELA
jgi:hypothetical protein